MIQLKYKYSLGQEFTFEGSDYIGYFNITNGVAYKGRDEQIFPLISKNNVSSIIELNGEYFDRGANTVYSPIYSKDQILFQPNEIINKNSINFKIELLYENFKNIFKFTKISNPNLPSNFTAYAAVTAVSATGGGTKNLINWFKSTTTILSSSLSSKNLGDINPVFNTKRKLINLVQGNLTENYTLFIAVSNSIFSYDLDRNLTTFNFLASTQKVGIFENYNFKDIISISSNQKNTLYVSDSGNNSIFKLGVDTIVNRDRSGTRNFVLTQVVGNSGSNDSNIGQVDELNFGNDNLYVYDKSEKIIKQLDKELNLIKIYKNDKLFKENKFISLTLNKNNNNLYILFENYKVVILDAINFNKIDEYNFETEKTLFPTDVPKKLIFSRNNSNAYYLVTNNNIFKYFLSTKNVVIGKFNITQNVFFVTSWETTTTPFTGTPAFWDSYPSGRFFKCDDVDILESPFNFDRIILLSDDRFLEFKEDNNFKTLLNNEDPTFINLSEILLKDEMFNNISFNNLIYKFLHNINILGSNVGKKYNLRFTDNKFKVLDNFESIDLELKNSKVNIDSIKNFYAGVNETVSTLVFNRIFSNLYEYQEDIASLLKSETINTRLSPLTSITF